MISVSGGGQDISFPVRPSHTIADSWAKAKENLSTKTRDLCSLYYGVIYYVQRLELDTLLQSEAREIYGAADRLAELKKQRERKSGNPERRTRTRTIQSVGCN